MCVTCYEIKAAQRPHPPRGSSPRLFDGRRTSVWWRSRLGPDGRPPSVDGEDSSNTCVSLKPFVHHVLDQRTTCLSCLPQPPVQGSQFSSGLQTLRSSILIRRCLRGLLKNSGGIGSAVLRGCKSKPGLYRLHAPSDSSPIISCTESICLFTELLETRVKN